MLTFLVIYFVISWAHVVYTYQAGQGVGDIENIYLRRAALLIIGPGYVFLVLPSAYLGDLFLLGPRRATHEYSKVLEEMCEDFLHAWDRDD